MSATVDLFRQCNSSHQFSSVSIREMIFFTQAPCDLLIYQNHTFQTLLKEKQIMRRDILTKLIQNGVYELFIEYPQLPLFRQCLQEKLHQISRTISAKSSIQNVHTYLSLLIVNMEQLLNKINNHEALNLQYSSIKNLISFLIHNEKIIPSLYQNLQEKNYHYTSTHPLLSTLLLLSFLNYLNIFNKREIELLCICNYFKDIGNALIPKRTLSVENLTPSEKKIIAQHPQYSIKILKGRIPLDDCYFHIISDHHHQKENEKSVKGIESVLLELIDQVTAMTSLRPYRPPMTLYSALDKIKDIYSYDYEQEFFCLVHFLQKFFGQLK